MHVRLTPPQQRDLIAALSRTAFGVLELARIQLLTDKLQFECSGIQHLMIEYRLTDHPPDLGFRLLIGYLELATGFNPQTISLYQVDHTDPDSPRLVLLSGLSYVIDGLRHYGIWP